MPVIVPKNLESAWLDPEHKDQKELLSILKPYPSEEMECLDQYPVQFHR
jgi:putative SOS response-associated peptidase YedK